MATEQIKKICVDEEIQRACELQAKWNGTTVEEEYKETVKYRNKKNKLNGFKAINSDDVSLHNANTTRILDKYEAQGCKYYNQNIKGINNPCSAECNLMCPNCIVRL